MKQLVLVLVLALAGCHVCDPSETTCPTPASIRGECMAERSCSLDGNAGWCTTAGCKVGRGQTVEVPIDTVDLDKIRTLFVDYRTEAAGAPDPTAIEATLDGQKGTAKALDSSDAKKGALVAWSPFPDQPRVLTLKFEDGTLAAVDPNFQFEDAACEADDQACLAR